jgi:hypothetical protein
MCCGNTSERIEEVGAPIASPVFCIIHRSYFGIGNSSVLE